jgi:probable rRNA maturation factor
VDPDSKRLTVSVTDGTGRRVRDGGLGRWLESIAPAGARGELGVAIVSDARIRALNREFRNTDRATDVLAFPREQTGSRANRAAPRAPSPETSTLGDIVIARGVASRQARQAGHSEQTELRVLALHGLLHLLGYDHHGRLERGRMARMEARLRARGGLREGLIERAAGPRA